MTDTATNRTETPGRGASNGGAAGAASEQVGTRVPAAALLDGRDFVMPDDVRKMAPAVLPHRLRLSNESRYSGLNASALVAELLDRIPMPV